MIELYHKTKENERANSSHRHCRHEILITVVIFAIALSPFIGVLRLPFIADDFDLYYYIKILSLKEQIRTFSTLGGVYFRPMGLLFWRIDHFIWGGFAAGYHLTNLLLHAAVASMLALLSFRITRQRLMAIGAGILFMSYPLHIEVIAHPTARFASSSTLFTALSIYLYIESISRKSGRRYLLSFIAATAAYLSKEDAFILPAMLIFCDILFYKNKPRRFIETASNIMKRWLPHLLLASCVFIVRAIALSKALGYQDQGGKPMNPFASMRSVGFAKFLSAVEVHLVPVSRSEFGHYHALLWTMLIVVFVLAILILKSRSGIGRFLVFSAAWWMLGLAPVLPFLAVHDLLESSRYIYHATAGFVLILSALAFGGDDNDLGIRRIARFSIGFAVFIGYVYFSFLNMTTFKQAGAIIDTIYEESSRRPIYAGETWVYMGLPNSIGGALLLPTDHTLKIAVLIGSGQPLDTPCRIVRKDDRALEKGDYPERGVPLDKVSRIVEWDKTENKIWDRTKAIQERMTQRRNLIAENPILPPLRIPAGPGGRTPMQPTNDLQIVGRQTNGEWKYAATGYDPFFRSPLMRINPLIVKEIIIPMAISEPSQGEISRRVATLSFRSSTIRDFVLRNSIEFDVIADGAIHEYRIDVANHPGWLLLDDLAEIRLDPITRPGEILLGDIVIMPFSP